MEFHPLCYCSLTHFTHPALWHPLPGKGPTTAMRALEGGPVSMANADNKALLVQAEVNGRKLIQVREKLESQSSFNCSNPCPLTAGKGKQKSKGWSSKKKSIRPLPYWGQPFMSCVQHIFV